MSTTSISFHDPRRVQMANGRPCWLGLRAVLPDVSIRPTSPSVTTDQYDFDLYTVMFMVPEAEQDGTWDGAFSWVCREDFTLAKVHDWLDDWYHNPEAAIKVFRHELPRAGARFEPASGETTGQSLSELDL